MKSTMLFALLVLLCLPVFAQTSNTNQGSKVKLIVAGKKGDYRKFYGFKNEKGETLVEPIYLVIDTLSPAIFRVGVPEGKYAKRYGLMDRQTFKLLLPAVYQMPEKLYPWERGLRSETSLFPMGDKKFGFIDTTGTFVIPQKYDYANSFFSGLAAVSINGKTGYVDVHGKEVIPIKYGFAGAFHKGYAVVMLNEKWGIINTAGEVVAPIEYEHIGPMSDDYLAFNRGGTYSRKNSKYEGGKWGFMDYTGKEFLPAIYEDLPTTYNIFVTGVQNVKLNGVWQTIDLKGNIIKSSITITQNGRKIGYTRAGGIVVEPQYDRGLPFYYGYAVVGNYDRKGDPYYGYIDSLGRKVTPLKYSSAMAFSESLGAVSLSSKWGFVDKQGKEVTDIKYESAGPMKNGLAPVKLNGKSGFVDQTGKEVIALKYDDAHVFSEGLALVKLNGSFAFLDPSGKEVILMQPGDAGSFSSGRAWIKKGGKYGYIDKTGKEVIPLRYDYAENFTEGVAAVTVGKDDANGRGSSMSFYIDPAGNKAIQAEFPRAYSFRDGRALVFTSRGTDGYVNAKTYIDITGKYLEPVQGFTRTLSCEEKTQAISYRVGDVVEYSNTPILYVITAYYCYNDSYEARTNGYFKGNYEGKFGSFPVSYFKDPAFRKVNAATCPVCHGKGQWAENKEFTKTDVDNYNANVPGGKVVTTTTYNRTENVTCGQCQGVGVVKQP